MESLKIKVYTKEKDGIVKIDSVILTHEGIEHIVLELDDMMIKTDKLEHTYIVLSTVSVIGGVSKTSKILAQLAVDMEVLGGLKCKEIEVAANIEHEFDSYVFIKVDKEEIYNKLGIN